MICTLRRLQCSTLSTESQAVDNAVRFATVQLWLYRHRSYVTCVAACYTHVGHVSLMLGYDDGFMPRPRLFLIDSFGFIFRAYHARARSGAPPMRTTTGMSTEAVYIFHNMLRKLLTDVQAGVHRRHFRERGAHVSRPKRSPSTRRTAPEMPDDLAAQIPYVRRLLEAMRIPILEYPGFEADDVIGTIARRAEEAGEVDVVIVSSDKDMLQLVTDRVSMLNPMKDDTWYDPAKTEEFMGVPPGAGGGPAGAEGRRDRQYSRRAGHRRQGRARPDRAVRHRSKRASSAPPKSSARCIAKACRIIGTGSC